MQESLACDEIDPTTIRLLYEGEQLTFRQVAQRLGVSPWSIYRLMRQHGISRRRGAEQNYVTYKTKPQFAVKNERTSDEEQLRIAGVMLYWGEGTKTGKVVNLANSDPKLIGVFMRFLRQICGVAESRLRVLLYAYENQDIDELKMFWSHIMQIPLSQFTKPYVKALTPNANGRTMAYGLVHIRYADKRLLELLHQWTKELAHHWAGT